MIVIYILKKYSSDFDENFRDSSYKYLLGKCTVFYLHSKIYQVVYRIVHLYRTSLQSEVHHRRFARELVKPRYTYIAPYFIFVKFFFLNRSRIMQLVILYNTWDIFEKLVQPNSIPTGYRIIKSNINKLSNIVKWRDTPSPLKIGSTSYRYNIFFIFFLLKPLI